MRKSFAVLSALAVLFSVFLWCETARSGLPYTEPILRVETGMHTAPIRRVDVSADDRFLVTSSFDKTARVWDLHTGRPLQVLRPPINLGNDGRLDAVAISPDGRVVACGGWTGYGWDHKHSIYLFDRQTGRIIRTVDRLPNVILHLAFSPDGRYLAASLGRKNGVRVFSVPEFNLVGQDLDYTTDSYCAAFDRQNRLAVSSYDGTISLYDQNYRRTARIKGPGGKRPYILSFSPDGEKLAVGYSDTTVVNVLSGRNLTLLYNPNLSGIEKGNLSKVCWSHDGRYLFAAGKYSLNGSYRIVRWDREGLGGRETFEGASDTIMHLKPLHNGGVAFGSGDTVWGLIEPDGRRMVYQERQVADYRNNREGFMLSSDGMKVGFSLTLGGRNPAMFSIADRELHQGRVIEGGLNPPLFQAPGLKVEGWKNTYHPKLNGRKLQIDRYETSRSLAVMPDGSGFLLGTSWSLRFFDRKGEQLWRIPIPGAAWSVNIAANGRVAAAAYSDGSIRWYELKAGRELLAFFPLIDGSAWVLWSPGGYYDASPGGENLIGWHVNRGVDRESDFFPVSRFRQALYRPDVLAKVLELGGEDQALIAANTEANRAEDTRNIEDMLPPVIRILSPPDGAGVDRTTVRLKYTVRSPNGEPVTGVKVLIDGRPVDRGRGISVQTPAGNRDAREMELTVDIPPRNVEIGLIAENRLTSSEPALVRLKWTGAGEDEEFTIKPKLWVLAIGVSDYEDDQLDLGFAAKDARDFTQAVQTQQGALYREVNVRLLTDEKASKGDILDGLEWMERQVTSKDVAMIFLAGHGVNDQVGDYYFLPKNTNLEKLRRTGLPFTEIQKTVSTLAGKTLFFVDTCHAGNVMGVRRGAADINALVNELASAENGAVVFASSTGRQYSLENKAWGNGAFTLALVEALKGKADYTGQGKITVNMIDLYLAERVKELTEGRQTPTTTKPQTIQDFPVAVIGPGN